MKKLISCMLVAVFAFVSLGIISVTPANASPSNNVVTEQNKMRKHRKHRKTWKKAWKKHRKNWRKHHRRNRM